MGIDQYTLATGSQLPELKHITDDMPGYARLPWGKSFTYRDATGNTLKEKKVLRRLKALVLPPAWTDVWICKDPQGYLQATGRDDKGRKQYRYHQAWTTYQQAEKFSKMTAFVRALVPARVEIANLLAHREEGWTRRRVTALAVALLDETGMRIGNKHYHRRNGTVGLTTIRRKHMDVDDDGLHFEYMGKSKQDRQVEIDDADLVRLVQNVSELPGYEVFRYLGQDGKVHNLDSSDVNALISELVGQDFTAKSFRTWVGTSAAIEFYSAAQQDIAENPRRRLDTCLVERVADYLGNTVSICREYYIHPKVMAAVENQQVPDYGTAAENLPPAFREELDEAEVIAYYLLA